MDQIKIGRFIAQKRKDAGLTQVQLAEKLGVTDKSVSKWERGICLPDVSLYQRLCGELGMTLNEFFAGETIDKSEIEARSEENILGVARDGSNKRNKLKKIILVLSIALAVLAAGTIFAVHFIKEQGYFMNNYVRAYDLNDSEATMKTILSGNDADAQLFKYDVKDNYKSLTIDMDVYEKGKLVKSEGEMEIPFEDPADRKGIIAITGNHETGEAVITVATSGGTMASVSNVTLTSSVVDAKSLTAAFAKAGESAKNANTITLGAGVKKIAPSAFVKFKQATTLVVTNKKLAKKKAVKKALKGSNIKLVKVKASGNKKAKKKLLKKYKKAFSKKNCGKKVKVILA